MTCAIFKNIFMNERGTLYKNLVPYSIMAFAVSCKNTPLFLYHHKVRSSIFIPSKSSIYFIFWRIPMESNRFIMSVNSPRFDNRHFFRVCAFKYRANFCLVCKSATVLSQVIVFIVVLCTYCQLSPQYLHKNET